jgi:small redox-active disulfide protein 2
MNMALFKFCKAKETACCETNKQENRTACSCGGECGNKDDKTARFIVLGACCDKSRMTYENVRQAVKDLGFADEVINIGDEVEIAKYGVMQTPALVVDGRVVSFGRMLKTEDVKKIFAKLEVK